MQDVCVFDGVDCVIKRRNRLGARISAPSMCACRGLGVLPTDVVNAADGPQPVLRRQSQIRSCSSTARSRGERCGRLGRSNSALVWRPPSNQRCHQRCAVAGDTPKANAASLSEQPASIAATSAARPASPSLALASHIHPSPPLGVESGKTHSLKGGPDRTSAVQPV
jgi:hypothetical protein